MKNKELFDKINGIKNSLDNYYKKNKANGKGNVKTKLGNT